MITRDPARAAHIRDLPIQIVTADVRDRPSIRGAATIIGSAVHGFAGPAACRRNRSIAMATRT